MKIFPHRMQPQQHCQQQFDQASQNAQPHNIMNYSSYNSQHSQPNIMTNNTINQQANFSERLTSGDVNNHVTRGNKQHSGGNIQVVDMDVNEILKVGNDTFVIIPQIN